MNEVNERWQRDRRTARKTILYLASLASVSWPVSYAASFPIYTMPQWPWWTVVSYVFLGTAIGCTVGAAVVLGVYIMDEEPLPGANR